jgi:hypothetical protein
MAKYACKYDVKLSVISNFSHGKRLKVTLKSSLPTPQKKMRRGKADG